MRIISGKYKRRYLHSVPGNTARPTTDFLKETIFNIIDDCEGISFLDLYAGSGGVGLEAISRGARRLVAVEFSGKSIAVILKNIKELGCESNCQVYKKRATAYLRKSEEKFDVIFLDPPYDKNLVNTTIAEIYANELLEENGIIVVEHSVTEKISAELREKIINERATRHSKLTILQY